MSWKKLKEESVYNGFRKIVQKTFLLPNGKTGQYDILNGRSFVSVVAITKEHQVLLVDQFRPGPETTMLCFPAGRIEDGESAEEAAQRELLEETGFKAGNLHFLKEVTHPYSHVTKYSFLATNCTKVGDQNLDELEFADVVSLPIDELKSLLIDPNSKNFINLDCGFLALNQLNKL